MPALERTFSSVSQRHETFRTIFVMINSIPMQRIAEHRDIELSAFNLQSVSKSETRRMVNDATPQPFDIAKDCALRVRLMRLSEQEHILVLVDHNIRPEGWPSNVFWSDDE